MTDLRPQLATVADGLDDLVPQLRDLAESTDSDTEAEALAEAARNAIRLARQLRALIHFVGTRSGRTGDASHHGGSGSVPETLSLDAPRGSRPRARAATSDETGDHVGVG